MHRMHGIVSKTALEETILSESTKKKVPISNVATLNAKAEFPVIDPKSNIMIEMQSGQHRMAILKGLYNGKPDEHWWLVTIFNNGISMYDSF